MSYFKRFLIFALSALLIVAPSVSYAASPAGWVAQNTVMNGAIATITAIKGGGSTAMKAVIQHTPTAAALGKNIVQLGGVVAVAYAVNELVGAGVDWVLDPANNSVTYTIPGSESVGGTVYQITEGTSTVTGSTPQEVCTAHGAIVSANNAHLGSDRWRLNSATMTTATNCRLNIYYSNVGTYNADFRVQSVTETIVTPPQKKSIPYSAVAEKIRTNAAAGHAPSQDFLKGAAVVDVNSGVIDSKLDAVAVPDTGDITDPNNPANPANPPFDPSAIIDAIRSVYDLINSGFSTLSNSIYSNFVKLGIIEGKVDAVAVDVQAISRSVAAIEGNTLDGQVINDAVDRVIAAGHTDTASIVAAIEAIEGNTLDGQVINDAIDRVIANDNVNAQAAADAATAAAEAAEAADAANTAAVTDAIEAAEAARAADAQEAKEAADAKAAADAAALEWAKEAPEAPTDTGVMVDEPISDFDSDKSYITFTGSCPPKYTASLSIMGATAPFEFDYAPICTVMSYLKPFIVGAGYIAAAYIIAGHSRGSKD